MPAIEAPYPKTDKEWRAQDDARALVQAELIKKDEERLTLAQEAAAKMAEREREEAKLMQRVAGKKKTRNAGGNKKTDQDPPGRRGSSHNVFKKI
jgi:hypothetical protein